MSLPHLDTARLRLEPASARHLDLLAGLDGDPEGQVVYELTHPDRLAR